MADYSVLMGHFKELNKNLKVGSVLEEGDLIGIMGSTGNSTGNHVHVTAAKGRVSRAFYRADYNNGSIVPLEAETNSFKSNKLFYHKGTYVPALVSYSDYYKSNNDFYQWRGDRYHFGVDLITSNSYLDANRPEVRWPKKVKATVIAMGDDRNVTSLGYGWWIVLHYSYDETPTKTRWDGIDISEFQVLDWATLNLSTDFAFIRAGVTLSESKKMEKDARFESHYSNLTKHGTTVGAYYYSVAESVEEAKKEAKFFLSLVKGKQFFYPLALDIEHDKQNVLSGKLKTEIIDAFGKIIEDAGYYFMVYSFESFFPGTDREVLKKYDHWIANTIAGAKRPANAGIWQYSHKGRIKGYSGDVDLNYGYMDYKEVIKTSKLNNLDKVVELPAEPTVKPAIPEYVTVRKGQTLWEIATSFGMKVDTIVKLNNLSNPDLIYPGQKLYLKTQQAKYYSVLPGDTLTTIANRYDTTVKALAKLNPKIKNLDLILVGDRIRIW